MFGRVETVIADGLRLKGIFGIMEFRKLEVMSIKMGFLANFRRIGRSASGLLLRGWVRSNPGAFNGFL